MNKKLIFSIPVALVLGFLIFTVVVPSQASAAPALTATQTVENVSTDVAATTSVTITGALAASATDKEVTIDGVAIDLGSSALTTAEVADKIVYQLTGGNDGAYVVATGTPSQVIFTRDSIGFAGNGTLSIEDANYTTIKEVKATRTLTIVSAPASTTPAITLTIGTCAVTFATTTAGIAYVDGAELTADEANCNDNVAVILLATSSNDVALSVSQIAQELRGLKNVSDTGHGALTVGGSSATVTFTTTGVETSATVITASLSSGSSITLTTINTAGVILVTSSVPSITFAGGSDITAQVVTFTPIEIPTSRYRYDITINGTMYSFVSDSGATAKRIVEGLQSQVNANAAVNCTEDDIKVTCTAAVPGTVFTYSTSVFAVSSSGGGGSSRMSLVSQTNLPPNLPSDVRAQLSQLIAQLQVLVAQAQSMGITLPPGIAGGAPAVGILQGKPSFLRDLKIGISGDDVRALQIFLNTKGFMVAASGPGSPGNETTIFGPLTKTALEKYQASVGLPAVGVFGPMTRTKISIE